MMILRQPDHVQCWTDSGLNDSAAEVVIVHSGDTLQVELSAPNEAITQISLRWDKPMPEGIQIFCDHWERGYGDLEWRGMVPERILPWYALTYNLQTAETQGFGVETGGGAIASWRIDQSGITLVLDVRCGDRGVLAGPRIIPMAIVKSLKSLPGESPFIFAKRFCRSLCPAPRLPSFPVYGGNDWYYAYGNNSDETIRRDTTLIRSLSPNRENAPFMVIDAGWFPAKGCYGGPYSIGNDNFPDLPGLAGWIKSQDVRPGIWIRPLLTAEAPASWHLPDSHPVVKMERGVFLDPSVPEVLEHVKQDIRRLHDWGYTLIKHDFSTFDITGRWGFQMGDGKLSSGGWTFADRTRTTAEIILSLYRAIREAAGDSLLIGCNTVGHLGAGLFELQRTGDDTSGQEWERTRKMGINTLAFRMPQNNTFFACDADCVGLTHAIPWELNRQWLELLAKSGTPLFVSADPKAVGPEQAAALREAFTLAATVLPEGEPMDWMHTTCPRRWKFGQEEKIFDF